MKSPLLLTLAITATSLISFATTGSSTQKSSKRKPQSFAKLHSEIAKSYKKHNLTLALTQTTDLLASVELEWRTSVEKKLPGAPKGYKILKETFDSPEAAYVSRILAGGAGISVVRKYTNGEDVLTLAIVLNSPMVQYIPLLTQTPEAAGEGAQVIELEGLKEKVKGLLMTEAKGGRSFSIILGDCVIQAKGSVEDDVLIQLLDPKALHKLESVLLQ